MSDCEGCPIFMDGYRSFEMCGHLDCWNEIPVEERGMYQ